MEAEDKETEGFYTNAAVSYSSFRSQPSTNRLEAFLARLPKASEILELGCGNGCESAFMMERGFRVSPTDGVAAMAAQAESRLGIPVGVLKFADLTAGDAFDGIWANACLLHVPKAELAAVLGCVHRALRPQGLFYASYKSGSEEGRDRFGRYFNNPSRSFLDVAYSRQPWSSVEIIETMGGGYDRHPTAWLHVTASKA